jgi:hypothetical protein
MVIAGGYERAPSRGERVIAAKPTAVKPVADKPVAEKPKPRSAQACRLKLLGLCL